MERRAYLSTMASMAGVPISYQLAEDGDDTDDGGGDADDEAGNGDPLGPTDLVGTFDDFESLESWRAYQDIGSISAATDYVATGTQSALLESSEEDGQVRVRRELDEPIDVRGVAPGLAVAADRSARVRIQLQDSDGHYVEFSRQVREGMPFVRDNFGLTRVSGEPDLTDVVTLQIVSWFGEGQLWIDDFYFVPTVGTGTVLLQFHGGYESHMAAAQIVDDAETDIPATAFVPTDRIRETGSEETDDDRLTLDQLETLSSAGWTIGSYGARGTTISGAGEVMEQNIVGPIEWLTDRGFDDGARFLAVPGSRYSADSYEAVREHYDLAFSGWGISQGYPADPHRCAVVTDPSPDQAVELLEWTAARGGFTSIAFTTFDSEDDREALEDLVSRIDELVTQGLLQVATPGQLLAGASELEADLEERAGEAEVGDDVVDDPDEQAIEDDETEDAVDPDEEVIEEAERDAVEGTDQEPDRDAGADESTGPESEPETESGAETEPGQPTDSGDGGELEVTENDVIGETDEESPGDASEAADRGWDEIGPGEGLRNGG
ncbi:polysaccharide deacetylase [Natrarchaeobaculum aegyptiacum]|uniref:Polysaccharide deacetylase n=1 Tax=Natrarchaeobaculum aegyptiacum TaxID=745377 RepID=A0A2Z2HS80_9EURY|nr:polysaccharide deacetylase [Natrarchaeobaculum aegyptiacum]ARS90000.1 hypothetical protein B1756_09845 [Natrarchaeobaculum aegyptiacum]